MNKMIKVETHAPRNLHIDLQQLSSLESLLTKGCLQVNMEIIGFSPVGLSKLRPLGFLVFRRRLLLASGLWKTSQLPATNFPGFFQISYLDWETRERDSVFHGQPVKGNQDSGSWEFCSWIFNRPCG